MLYKYDAITIYCTSTLQIVKQKIKNTILNFNIFFNAIKAFLSGI